MNMLDVCVTGCGGVVPKTDRHLSSAYLRYNGTGVLIDCGEGTQLAVKEAGFLLSRIGLILITHFHADHVTGLPGLLLSMGNEGRTEPVIIAGPEGIDTIVKALLTVAPELPFRVNTKVMGDYGTMSFEGMDITSFELLHTCTCLGYDIRVSRNGKFDKEKAEKNGVPMKYWKTLQKGTAVDGYTPDMVLGESRKGLHITYSTDSRPLDIISMMADDADLLICEGMYEGAKNQMAKEKKHMTIPEAANLARNAGCHELWLTHYSPSMPDPHEFADEAKKIFPNTVISRDGQCTTLKFED